MSAQEQMKKMLDELMGTKRDGESIEDGTHFTDSGVCKSFLMGLCPFDLFHNTKLDLGPCHKYHSLALKADYEQAAREKDYGYDAEQLDHLTSFVRDCDRKVEVNKKRLEDNQDEQDTSNEATSVHDLNENIGKMLAKSEELGADGQVEESLSLMKQVEELKMEKRKAEELYRNSLPVTATQQQKLRVCEICGAYLSLYDNDRRLADHFGGKLHMGFIKIRDRLAELQQSVAAKREAREKEREKRRQERDRDLEKERSADSREKERRRQRSHSRSREGSRRDRNRERSRSRDRRRGDKERYRDRRDGDRGRRYGDRDRRDGQRDRRDGEGDRRNGQRDRRERGRDRRDRDRDDYRSRDRSRSRERSRRRDRSRERNRSHDSGRNEERDGRRSRETSPNDKRSESRGENEEASNIVKDKKGNESKEDGEIDSAADCTWDSSSVNNDDKLNNIESIDDKEQIEMSNEN